MVIGCGLSALGAMVFGCDVGQGAPGDAEPAAELSANTAAMNIRGQVYALTWGEEFGGKLGDGQPRSYLDEKSWKKENLGVNYEEQAYTNRECPDHPDDWNYCVQDGKLTIRARKEALSCVVWQQCTATSACGADATCENGYCLYDKNGNGTWDHDECAPHLQAANPPANDRRYTSGRISTNEKIELRYGYIEFRARMPFAELPSGAVPPSGMWPAIWLLGANDELKAGGRNDSAGWPANGEIDVMEYTQIRENPKLYPSNGAMGLNALWRERPEEGELAASAGGWQPNACSAWPNGGDAKCDGDVAGSRLTWEGHTIDYHAWHTWGFLWDEDGFEIYLDDLPTSGGAPIGKFSIGDGATEYRQPMYLIMNLAVGGELGCLGWASRACGSSADCANGAACVSGKCQEDPGTCVDVDWAADGAKAKLEVDYLRWYHRASGYAKLSPAACQDGNGDGTFDNIIRNCGFNEDFTYHRTDLFFGGASGLTEVINEGGSRGYVQWVRIDNGGTEPWNVQARQEGVPLQAGTQMTWSVDLKASAPRTVPIKIVQATSPWTTIASFDCNVGTTWSTCRPPSFTPPTTESYKLEIDLGNNGTNNHAGTQVYIDDLFVGTTANACQPECTGKLCGGDGCGGTCGTCGTGLSCAAWGQCVGSGGSSSGGDTGSSGGDTGSSSGSPVRLEAERAALRGCFAEAAGDSGGKVVGFEGGDAICWSDVNMAGVTRVTAHVGAPYSGGQAQLRLNDTTLGSLALTASTGGWSSPNLVDISTAVSASGKGTLCLVGVTHQNGWVYSVDYLDLR